MNDYPETGAGLDAGSAVRLASAMRGQADARRQAEAARAALAAAEAKLEAATGEVDELKAGVTFEDLLELVATLSLRVSELEARDSGRQLSPDAELVVAAPALAERGQADWSPVPPEASGAPGLPVAPHAVALNPPQSSTPAEAQVEDPFAEGADGRRPPDRAVLYMNAYNRGFDEARKGLPDTMVLTRGWEFKGYREGRKHAAAGLEFDPLAAFVEEMGSCRLPIEPKVREQARKLSVILLKEHADQAGKVSQPVDGVEAGPRGTVNPESGASFQSDGDSSAPSGSDSDWESAAPGADDAQDESVEIPGFLQRRSQSETA